MRPVIGEPKTRALHERAFDNLRYIRDAMEQASAFTAVPGAGGVAMGLTAVVAAVVASGRRGDPGGWLGVWLVEALVGLTIGVVALLWKARRAGSSLTRGSGRKFVLGFAPPLAVGGLLTLALVRAGVWELLPGMWLLTYGTAVVSGGAFSVPVVPVLGGCFMAAGVVALLGPAAWGDAMMGLGFGGLQIVFGVWIARRHGG